MRQTVRLKGIKAVRDRKTGKLYLYRRTDAGLVPLPNLRGLPQMHEINSLRWKATTEPRTKHQEIAWRFGKFQPTKGD